MLKTSCDWAYSSKEKRACRATKDGRCYHPRGKGVGGSTMVNVMFYVRGDRNVFDRWRDEHECPGWGYSDVLPYFKKAERNTHDWGNKYHSQCGKMCVSFYNRNTPYINFFEDASNELGIPSIRDVNARKSGPGVVRIQGTQCNGRRFGAARAYIQPIKEQSNYRLIQNAIVTKIIFKGKRAIGVRFVRDGKTYTAMARKEVIMRLDSNFSERNLY